MRMTYSGMKGMMMTTGTSPLNKGFVDGWKFHATGNSGDVELERAWLEAAQDVYINSMPQAIWDLYCVFTKKQADYGPQNIALGGTKGVTQRMVDKMARLWNLQGLGNSKEKAPANAEEAIYDTLMDLADYGIIGMLTENGSWPLLSIEEAFDAGLVKSDTQQLELPYEKMGREDCD